MALDANINRIKFLRTKTAGSVPTAAVLDEGELAINLVDRTIYSKNGTNVVELGFGKGGSVSGAITAPQFNGPLVGNASTATTLQTPRTINGTSFNGSSNITFNNVVPNDNRLIKPVDSMKAAISTYFTSKGGLTSSTVDASFGDLIALNGYSDISGGKVNALFFDKTSKEIVHYQADQTATSWGQSHVLAYTTDNVASATVLQTARTIGGVSFNGSANINLPGVNIVGNQSTTGNAASLTTARSFSWTGDATGSLSFNGSVNVSAVLTLANSGVSAGTYKSVTVDTKGRVTAGTNVITGLVTSTAISGTTNAATSNTNTYLNIVETIGSAATTVGTSTQVTGAGTVTVTSDTAGKLTITGSQNITGNAGSATVLQTARTIGGVSFNGSANINLPGVNIVGNQSTTGNAATATSAAKWTTARTLTIGDSGKSVDGSGNVSWTRLDMGVPRTTTTTSVGIDNSESCIGYITNTLFGEADGALYSQVYSEMWKHQIHGDYRTGQIALRGKNNGTWQAWRTVLDSGNYNDYSPTKTGTGASGSWGIHIYGNAGSTTKLQTARSIGITGSGASGSISFDGTGNVNIPLVVATQATATNNTTIATTAFVQAVNIADTGSSATSLKLKTARTIGGVSFDGSANINLPGVNIAGNQSTTGNAGSATVLQTARMINGVSFNGTANITVADSTKLPLTGGTLSGNLAVSGTITATGNITAFSDARIKGDLLEIEDSLSKVQKLTGYTYTRTDLNDDLRYVGLIAQDVQAVVPEAVRENTDGTLSVDYMGLVGLLVQSIKELDKRIKDLEEA